MEKRFQMTAEGIVISALVVLTPTEQEKLECKDLEKAINHIANNLHIKWAVEISGNIATATISKQFGPVVGDNQAHEIEMAANNFMRAIEHLYLPCENKTKHPEEEEDCPVEEESDVVITFDAGNNGARIIKALREHMGLTVHAAQMRAMRGRIVCKYKDASLIMDNLDIAGARNIHIDEQLTDDLSFCNDIIENWDETDEMAQTTGALILCGVHGGNIQGVCGHIHEKLLQNMFIAYIQSM